MSENEQITADDDVAFQLARIRHETGLGSIHHQPVIDSTSDWAISVGKAGRQPLPALFLANRQTRGRGRGTRHWISPPGAMAFSLLVPRPLPLNAPDSGLVALLAADAICETILEQFNLTTQIKWPNDVYLGDAKLAGVLIESAGPDKLVIGCGANICNPTDGLPNATALVQWLPERPAVEPVVTGVVRKLLSGLAGLAAPHERDSEAHDVSGNRFAMLERCRRRDALQGRLVECRMPDESVRGIARGIDDNGGLIVEGAGRQSRVLKTGSVVLLDPPTA
jgi:BirA family biotin operon repressor/biotin-[acetyl-CoA-carboxylase] ligase